MRKRIVVAVLFVLLVACAASPAERSDAYGYCLWYVDALPTIPTQDAAARRAEWDRAVTKLDREQRDVVIAKLDAQLAAASLAAARLNKTTAPR